ncbi:MAG: hypothetical protein COB96_04285 [Planctomycetota bacterium]|nr:MAG: hypothetical protein COB96_04285 [Planctomycetota bacterium]
MPFFTNAKRSIRLCVELRQASCYQAGQESVVDFWPAFFVPELRRASDMLKKLKAEGFSNACRRRIGHAIVAGHISRPTMDGSLAFRFEAKHLREIRKYLANVPQPGRRKIAVPA